MYTWPEIRQLHDNQVPESMVLDYKRDCYGQSDHRELLKDISSFANTRGGHIIIGVEEEQGVPKTLVGVDPSLDLDAEVQRMTQVVNTGLDPAFTSVRFHRVPGDNGTTFLVVEIARSPNAPHRVASGNYHRFFVRDSNGKHEATMPELRDLFTFGELARERFRDFVRERVEIVTDEERDTTGIEKSGGLMFVHIVPQAFLFTSDEIDLDAMYGQHQLLRAFSTMGINRRYNFDGLMVYSGGDKLWSYTQVFRNGIIEAVMGDIHREVENYGKTIAGIKLEQDFFQTFPGYLWAYDAVGVPPPYVVQISLVGVKAAYYAYQERAIRAFAQPRLDRDRMFLAECVVETIKPTSDIHQAVKPAFDSLYNALDRPECPNFREDGAWDGR